MSQCEYLLANELLSTVTQKGMEVFQVTTNPDIPSNILYNYHQAISPNSRYLLVNRIEDGMSRVWMCDLEDDFSLTPVMEEGSVGFNAGHESTSFSPDGNHIWINRIIDGRLKMFRRTVDGGPVEIMFDLDVEWPEFGGRKIMGVRWCSFSHDGKRMLCNVSINGVDKYYSMAVLTFDMENVKLNTVFELGPRNWNNKSQYAPAFGPDGEYLICVNDNFSKAWFDKEGKWSLDHVPGSELGGSEHLVDEHGNIKYTYPVGRDRPHQNISHWSWFGKSINKVFHCDSVDTAPFWRGTILYTEPVPADKNTVHLGRHHPQANQLELTRHIKRPDVCHICVSMDSTAMVCDTIGYHDGMDCYLYTATIEEDGNGKFIQPKYLLHPKSSWKPYWTETMPCFSPDKKWIFFNSDYPGVNGYRGKRHVPQVFAVRGFKL